LAMSRNYGVQYSNIQTDLLARISHTSGLAGGRHPEFILEINVLREIGHDSGKNSLFF
jgi:hypothetical protein